MKKTALFLAGQFLVATLIASAQTTPPPPLPPQQNPGFIQFNNLTIVSVSGVTAPAEILASASGFPIEAMNGAKTNAPSPSMANCLQYQAQDSENGAAIPCPVRSDVYRIEVDASTQLSLRDRTAATLGDLAPGDRINVFGDYASDGTIHAYLVRDVSKPVEMQTIQLNNVALVFASGTNLPATLAVTQEQSAPCYYFGANGNNTEKRSYACPLGLPSFSSSSNQSMQNVQAPPSLTPTWMSLRKYAVNVDAHTILLDRNRTRLSISDLKIGDRLNVYGETSDNGQTVTADIIRDLSQPLAASNYTGSVTKINSDGSFVIQTNDGRTITVQNQIQVGATVTLRGVLDEAQGILSQISQIYFGGNVKAAPGVTAGGRCGGNTLHPPTCSAGYHCAPAPGSNLPFGDVGGICVAN